MVAEFRCQHRPASRSVPVKQYAYARNLWAGILLFAAATAAGAATPTPPPHVSYAGPSLAFDFPGVEVGVAEYTAGPTGTTVLRFPKRVMAAIDVRGGAPGTVNSDALRLVHEEAFVSAIVLSGGSAYGLSAATGVANALKEKTANPGDWHNVAVVAGAIIFDMGDRRYNAVTPDDALGRAALTAARPGWFPLGARGAGSFAMQGAYLGERQHSGQGAALRQAGPTKVLVVTVVNAAGTIVARDGHLARCVHPVDKACDTIADALEKHLAAAATSMVSDSQNPFGEGPTANTTLTVVVTNQVLAFSALQRLAIQVHNSMSRAIQPFGTMVDGDTLFAVSTGEVINSRLNPLDLSTLASETAWDAVLASIPSVPQPTVADGKLATNPLTKFIGHYRLAPEVSAEVRGSDAGLEVTVTGRDSAYLPAGKPVRLERRGARDFTLDTPAADRLRFDVDAHGKTLGFTINPGTWPVAAPRESAGRP